MNEEERFALQSIFKNFNMGFPSVSAVKNPPATQETQVGYLEGMATHSSILAWRIPMDRGAW